MTPATARRYLRLSQVDWRIVGGLIALNTVCLFFYRHLEYLAYDRHRPPMLTFLEEAVGGLAGFAVSPLIYLVAIRFPLVSVRWRFHLLFHLVAVCLISIVHTTLIALFRMTLFPLFGFGQESYGQMPVRYPMEFSHLFIYYWYAVALIYLFHELRFARERELGQARLEASLAEAQLRNLRLQLEPHFLFNALNVISATLYEDPRAADTMIGRLGELLRHVLEQDGSQLIPLRREIEILRLYTDLMEARFEKGLQVSVDVEEQVQGALVPQLLLQPLVENAIRHGMNTRFEVRVTIAARLEGKRLLITVRDEGPGVDETRPLRSGIGLKSTRERLERLFGEAGQFAMGNAPGGGALVKIQIPFEQPAGSHVETDATLTAP